MSRIMDLTLADLGRKSVRRIRAEASVSVTFRPNPEVRMRLSERFRNRVEARQGIGHWIDRYNKRETSLGARWSDAGGGVHWLEKTF